MAVIFIITLLPAIFINTAYGYMPVLCLLFLGILSFTSLIFIKRGFSVSDESDGNVTAERGEQVSLRLNVRNDSLFYLLGAEVCLVIENSDGSISKESSTSVTISPHSGLSLSVKLDMPHIGEYRFGISKVILHDYFGIFSLKKEIDERYNAVIIPRTYPVNADFSSEETVETDADTKINISGGSDYVGVREYAPGDPIKQIHWKLSAHTVNYLTKTFESNRQNDYEILLDLSMPASDDAGNSVEQTGKSSTSNCTRDELMEITDCLLELALSINIEIKKQDEMAYLIYSDRYGKLKRKVINSTDDYVELIEDIGAIENMEIHNSPKPGSTLIYQENTSEKTNTGIHSDGCSLLQEYFSSQNSKMNTIFISANPIARTLSLLTESSSHRKVEEVFIVLHEKNNSRDIERLKKKLSKLEERSIGCTLVSTEVNHREGGLYE